MMVIQSPYFGSLFSTRGVIEVIDITSTGDASVHTFLEALAARQSTPGGGGAAALTGSQAAALVSMVINFTIGGKRYADVQDEMKKALEQSEWLRADLLDLADKDVAAFTAVSACYGMRKSTDDEKATRTAAMQTALKSASEVPFLTAERCLGVVQMVEFVAANGNKNVISDDAVALYLAIAALKSAIVNVNINLKFIRDEAFVEQLSAKRDVLLSELEIEEARGKDACEKALGLQL
jgi:formiminotetrahydrofolate cyclodeaminase